MLSVFRQKKYFVILSLVVFCALLWFGASYFGIFRSALDRGEIREFFSDIMSPTEVPYTIEEVVTGLEVPWSIVWTSPERMLIAERPGRLRVYEGGKLLDRPLATFTDVSNEGEEGLMGVAVDPTYAANHYLYACYAYGRVINNKKEMVGRLVRLIDHGANAMIDRILLDNIPSAQFHAGCRVAFGPDGKLYVTTGDATEGKLAQRIDSLAGKILRMNADGSIPSDNPFPDSRVWSFGHRNPQGIAWHPITGLMYETEHGPSVFDGPAGGDEVNAIVRGGNYGWPLVSHEKTREGTIAPLLLFTPAEAPASAMFYTGTLLPQFTGNFFFGALKGEGLVRVSFDAEHSGVIRYEKLAEVSFGRIRAVAEGLDGAIYFSTSNRDGRGEPHPSDDRIFRIRPKDAALAPIVPKEYRNGTLGLSFTYPSNYFLEVHDRSTGARYKHEFILTEDTEEHRLMREGKSPPREGPPAITVTLYQNDLDRMDALGWIKGTSYSNWKLGDGAVTETSLGGRIAYRYAWDGLYRGETIVTSSDRWIYAFSVTSLTPDDAIRAVFEQLLTTVVF